MSTNWILVPVPEHLAQEVADFTMRLRMEQLIPLWDAESAAEHLSKLTADQRAVLRIVVQRVLATGPPPVGDVAAQLGLSEREVLGRVAEINEVRTMPFRGEPVFVRPEPGRLLYMHDVVAEVFQDAGVTAPTATG